jgi:allantoinase
LLDGTLDLIASDHSPCPPELKKLEHGDFFAAWGGIASLELGLSAIWTARPAGVTIEHVIRWMSTAPARLAGLKSKGAIEVGRAADLIAFDPNASWMVDAKQLRQRHPVTPYDGRSMLGRVERLWLGGR